MKTSMRLAVIAGAVLTLSVVPLLVVGFLDPTSNPIGLGLLFVAGFFISMLLLALAAIAPLWRWLR